MRSPKQLCVRYGQHTCTASYRCVNRVKYVRGLRATSGARGRAHISQAGILLWLPLGRYVLAPHVVCLSLLLILVGS